MTGRDRLRYVLMAAVVAICAALIAVVFFYNRVSLPVEIIADVAMQADVTLSRVNYTESENGVAKWNLIADSAAHDVKDERTDLKNVQLTLFDQENTGDVVLTAKTGVLNMNTRRVDARGDVVIATQSGYRFTSDSASFQGESAHDGTISTDDKIKIVTDKFIITGTGLRGDLARGKFTIKNKVTAIYSPQSTNGGQ
jgi:LPS export ABC transporter protein LptC